MSVKKTFRLKSEQTVAYTVVQFPQLRPVLERFGIDYCCGGQRTLVEAVQAAGLECNAIINVLEDELTAAQAKRPPVNWNAEPISVLADHILKTHHVFTREQLERLDNLLQKVLCAHKKNHGELLDALQRAFNRLSEELSMHLQKEEQILFPAIKNIDAFVSGSGTRPVFHCGTIESPVRQMMIEHDSAAETLAEWRCLTENYKLPKDACQTFAALYDGFQALEADLHEHIHLENNILFPKSMAQENSMNS